MELRSAYIVEARRTPIAKSDGLLKNIDPIYLGSGLISKILSELGMSGLEVDEVIIGNVANSPQFSNISRIMAEVSSLPSSISAYTVNKNCASGIEAISNASILIASGRADLVLAGGVESMSLLASTYIYKDERKLKNDSLLINKFIMKIFNKRYKDVSSLNLTLKDYKTGLYMGETAEILSKLGVISRSEQDEFSVSSHYKALRAHKNNLLCDEVVPIIYGDNLNQILSSDTMPRIDCTVDKLKKLKPIFSTRNGTITSGNSCSIADGASMAMIASDIAIKKYSLKAMARIVDFCSIGISSEYMGVGPAIAISKLLKKNNLNISDIDLFEINEAFAAQVLAVVKCFEDSKFGSIFSNDIMNAKFDNDKLNVNGGSIALGHPVGMSGNRIVITLAYELRRRGARYGVASLCVGGGQGVACLIENVSI